MRRARVSGATRARHAFRPVRGDTPARPPPLPPAGAPRMDPRPRDPSLLHPCCHPRCAPPCAPGTFRASQPPSRRIRAPRRVLGRSSIDLVFVACWVIRLMRWRIANYSSPGVRTRDGPQGFGAGLTRAMRGRARAAHGLDRGHQLDPSGEASRAMHPVRDRATDRVRLEVDRQLQIRGTPSHNPEMLRNRVAVRPRRAPQN